MSVRVAWSIGNHFQEYAHEGHVRLVVAALKDPLLGLRPTLTTKPP